MCGKKLIKLIGLQIRMYKNIMGETADTTSFTNVVNHEILFVMKELMDFKEAI